MEILINIVIALGAALLTAVIVMFVSLVAFVCMLSFSSDDGIARMASGRFEWLKMLLEAIMFSAAFVFECFSNRTSKAEIRGG